MKRSLRHLLLGLATALAWLCGEARANPPPKPALLFDIDQGFSFGVVETLDLDALNRILDALSQFRSRFNVYAIFSPMTANEGNLRKALEASANREIPFYLDVFSSDVMAIANIKTPARADADPAHDLAISLERLRSLKADPKIGRFLRGVRIHELMASDFTVKTCLQHRFDKDPIHWCDHFSRNAVDSDVFDIARVKPFLDFAKSERMTVFWSDWKWDSQTSPQQRKLRELLDTDEYSDTIILAYANNLPDEAARNNDANWRRWDATYRPLVGRAIRGLGLSDQSWACASQRGCPADVIDDWAERALNAGAVALEFEPGFYFFDIPDGDDKNRRTPYGSRKFSGAPRASTIELARSLNVETAALEAGRLKTEPALDAACVTFKADKMGDRTDNRFRLTATFKNVGAQAWPKGATVQARLGPQIISTPDPKSQRLALPPGHTTSLSFQIDVPPNPKHLPFIASMRSPDAGVFGQPCSIRLVADQR